MHFNRDTSTGAALFKNSPLQCLYLILKSVSFSLNSPWWPLPHIPMQSHPSLLGLSNTVHFSWIILSSLPSPPPDYQNAVTFPWFILQLLPSFLGCQSAAPYLDPPLAVSPTPLPPLFLTIRCCSPFFNPLLAFPLLSEHCPSTLIFP